MTPTIIPIPDESLEQLASVAGWHETSVEPGQRVAPHHHAFQATYFTFGISTLVSSDGEVSLPRSAMVIIPCGVEHGWLGPKTGGKATIGHFHDGHGDHYVEKVVLNG